MREGEFSKRAPVARVIRIGRSSPQTSNIRIRTTLRRAAAAPDPQTVRKQHKKGGANRVCRAPGYTNRFFYLPEAAERNRIFRNQGEEYARAFRPLRKTQSAVGSFALALAGMTARSASPRSGPTSRGCCWSSERPRGRRRGGRRDLVVRRRVIPFQEPGDGGEELLGKSPEEVHADRRLLELRLPGLHALHPSPDFSSSLASRAGPRPSPAIIDLHGLPGQYPRAHIEHG
jgi:hypothetical protein